MQNFKVNSHIPVYPLQSFSLKSLRVGNCLSCPMADSGVCTQLPELGGGKYSGSPRSLYWGPPPHTPLTLTYTNFAHTTIVWYVLPENKYLSVQESPSSSKILGLCSLC